MQADNEPSLTLAELSHMSNITNTVNKWLRTDKKTVIWKLEHVKIVFK